MTERTNILSRPWAALSVALSVAALGATLGGCASEDYHCDTTACYYCDGVGCRQVTPPTRTPCHGDYDCHDGTVCTSAGCATRCTRDADCARGWVCRGGGDGGQGLCVAPSEPPPTSHPGDTCTNNSQCTNGTVCINGVCTSSPTPACTADTDCTNGRICITGRCVDPATICRFDSECGTGRVCVNNECHALCGGTAPACPTGEQCLTSGTTMYCGAPPPSMTCVHDADCGGSGLRCLNGACFPACNGGMGCTAPDSYCTEDGVCVTDTRPRPFCPTNACNPGSVCVGGVCRIQCSSSTECAMHDVTFRSCGRIPNRPETTTYCLTDHEFMPVCLRQSECSAGQNCIDGRCY